MGNELGQSHPLWLVESGDAFKHPIMTKNVTLYFRQDQKQYVGLDKPINNPDLLAKKAQFEARVKGLPKSVLPVGLKTAVGKPTVLRVLMGSMNIKDYCLILRQKGQTHLSHQHTQELLDFLLTTGKSLEGLWESAPDLNLSEIFVMNDGFRILSPFASSGYPRETFDSYESHQKQMMSRVYSEEDKLKLDQAQKTFYLQVRQTMQKIGISVLCAALLKVDDDIFLEGLENKFDDSHKLIEQYLKTFSENYSATLCAQVKNLIYPTTASVISFEHLTIPARPSYTWQIMDPNTYQDNFVRKMVSQGGFFDNNYSDLSVNRATYQDILQIQSIRHNQTILATSEQDKREKRQNPVVIESAIHELPRQSNPDPKPEPTPQNPKTQEAPKPPAAAQQRPEPPRVEPLTNGRQQQPGQTADPRKPAAGTAPLPVAQPSAGASQNKPPQTPQQPPKPQQPAADPRLAPDMLPYGKLEQLMRLDRRSVPVTDPNLSASFQPQLNLTEPNPSLRFPVLSTNDPAAVDGARTGTTAGPKKHEWTLEEQRRLQQARLRDRGRPEAFTPDLMKIRSVRAQVQQQQGIAPRPVAPNQYQPAVDPHQAGLGRISYPGAQPTGPQGVNNLAQKPNSGIPDRLSSPINGWKIGDSSASVNPPLFAQPNTQRGPIGQNNLVSLEEFMRYQAGTPQTDPSKYPPNQIHLQPPVQPPQEYNTAPPQQQQYTTPYTTLPQQQQTEPIGPNTRQASFQGIEFKPKPPTQPSPNPGFANSATRPLNIGNGTTPSYRVPSPPFFEPSEYQNTYPAQPPIVSPQQPQTAYPPVPLPDRWTAAPPVISTTNTNTLPRLAPGNEGLPIYLPGQPVIELDTPETQLLLLMRKMQREAQGRHVPRAPAQTELGPSELMPFRSALGKVERV